MKKKGEVEIQFAWIFTAIVGAVIISFFVTIGLKLTSNASTEIGNELAYRLDQTIASVGASSGGGATFSYPKDSKVRFSCDVLETDTEKKIASGFLVEDAGIQKDLTNRILFSPLEIEDNTIYHFTKEFKPGQKVRNFNYVSSPSTVYVIRNDQDGKGKELYDAIFVSDATKILKTPASNLDLKVYNPKHVNYIIFDAAVFEECTETRSAFGDCRSQDLGLDGYENSIVTIVLIDTQNSDFNAGKIKIATADEQYVYGEEQGEETGFYGIEMALGAVYSGDLAAYNCNMLKGIDAWQKSIELTQKRIEMLYNDIDSGLCQEIYSLITEVGSNPTEGNLDRVKMLLDQIKNDHVNVGVKFEDIYHELEDPTSTESVAQRNLDLRLSSGGCPLVY